MEEHPDTEMKEMMEEMAEDLGRTQLKEKASRRRGISSVLTPTGQVILYGGIGIIVFILVINVFLIFGGGNKGAEKKISAITARVDLLEKGLNQLDKRIQGAKPLDKQLESLEQSLSKQDRTMKALRERISKLGQETAQLKKKIPLSGIKKVTKSTTKKRFHDVQKGETLFRIAKKYGIDVEELRRINKLSKEKDIYPGQKLLIP